jgi:hypothetical protein
MLNFLGVLEILRWENVEFSHICHKPPYMGVLIALDPQIWRYDSL